MGHTFCRPAAVFTVCRERSHWIGICSEIPQSAENSRHATERAEHPAATVLRLAISRALNACFRASNGYDFIKQMKVAKLTSEPLDPLTKGSL